MSKSEYCFIEKVLNKQTDRQTEEEEEEEEVIEVQFHLNRRCLLANNDKICQTNPTRES